MRILFVTPECAPLAKTGGLGDVAAALPAALRRLGLDVRVLLPAYAGATELLTGLRDLATLEIMDFKVRLLEAGGYLLLDCPQLYRRDGGPYQDMRGEDWPDNAVRFGLLSRVAALLGTPRSPLDWRPHVVHCNDWPAALAPVLMKKETTLAATVLTVHNLSFQGNFGLENADRLGVAVSEDVEFHGRLSFLKGGLACADVITTVSPTYAREIQAEEQGCGLDGLLRRRSGVLTGILNGIDTETWDPARDPRLAERYDADSLEKKGKNKAALQRRLGLEPRTDVPLAGMVGRLTAQKGIDLVLEAAPALGAAQLAVLGTGMARYERALAELAARAPGRIAVRIGFDEDLAHLIEAGADLFLMPSRFEPCGLNQMYSQRYGTPPVARATGGLADTVADAQTGFLFERAEVAALGAALNRALAAWGDPPRWRALQRAGMARDFSWAAPARRYADLYRGLATARRPA